MKLKDLGFTNAEIRDAVDKKIIYSAEHISEELWEESTLEPDDAASFLRIKKLQLECRRTIALESIADSLKRLRLYELPVKTK